MRRASLPPSADSSPSISPAPATQRGPPLVRAQHLGEVDAGLVEEGTQVVGRASAQLSDEVGLPEREVVADVAQHRLLDDAVGEDLTSGRQEREALLDVALQVLAGRGGERATPDRSGSIERDAQRARPLIGRVEAVDGCLQVWPKRESPDQRRCDDGLMEPLQQIVIANHDLNMESLLGPGQRPDRDATRVSPVRATTSGTTKRPDSVSSARSSQAIDGFTVTV